MVKAAELVKLHEGSVYLAKEAPVLVKRPNSLLVIIYLSCENAPLISRLISYSSDGCLILG